MTGNGSFTFPVYRHLPSMTCCEWRDASHTPPVVRNWLGWHHHQVLSLIAMWFLVLETLRGKKWTPAITVPQLREALSTMIHHAWKCHRQQQLVRERERKLRRNELARFYHYKARKKLAPLRLTQREYTLTVELGTGILNHRPCCPRLRLGVKRTGDEDLTSLSAHQSGAVQLTEGDEP